MNTVRFQHGEWTLQQYSDTYRAEQESARAALLRDEPWVVPGALTDKVDASGRLRPFFGDTTVYPVQDPDILAALTALQAQLYSACGSALADPLDPATFHMTLHGLSDSPERDAVEADMSINQRRFEARQKHLRTPNRVTMRATGLFPCLNISVLLGLVPIDGEGFARLAQAYNEIDAIRPATYWPRFHITLAYFRPVPVALSDRERIHRAIHAATTDEMTWTIPLDKLEYQHFTSMNQFTTLATPHCHSLDFLP